MYVLLELHLIPSNKFLSPALLSNLPIHPQNYIW